MVREKIDLNNKYCFYLQNIYKKRKEKKERSRIWRSCAYEYIRIHLKNCIYREFSIVNMLDF